jgi:hypothetical protein
MERRTREIWSNLIRQLERSGKSDEQFADERHIPVSTLRWWKWRLRRDGEDKPSLLPVRVITSTAPTARRSGDGDAAIEAMLTDGVCLRFCGQTPTEVVVEVVSRLRRC